MDTSKEYVKMCEKAEEIQALEKEYDQKYSIIPNLYSKYSDLFGMNGESIIPPDGQAEPKMETWLPRQDQLQEMIFSNEKWKNDTVHITGTYVLIHLVEMFTYHCKIEHRMEMRFQSIEQYWLGFVMKKLYNKQWNKETQQWQLI